MVSTLVTCYLGPHMHIAKAGHERSMFILILKTTMHPRSILTPQLQSSTFLESPPLIHIVVYVHIISMS